MIYTQITLGALLSHPDPTISRNATSILKTLQRGGFKHDLDNYGKCTKCGHYIADDQEAEESLCAFDDK